MPIPMSMQAAKPPSMPSLTRKKDFLDLKKTGQVVKKNNFFLVYKKNQLPYSRFAWGFYIKGRARSVRRNQLKRWGREWMRQKKHPWPHSLDVLAGGRLNPQQMLIKYEDFSRTMEELHSRIKM